MRAIPRFGCVLGATIGCSGALASCSARPAPHAPAKSEVGLEAPPATGSSRVGRVPRAPGRAAAADGSPGRVACGQEKTCNVPVEKCCADFNDPKCVPAGEGCPGDELSCDDIGDCPGQERCCKSFRPGPTSLTRCQAEPCAILESCVAGAPCGPGLSCVQARRGVTTMACLAVTRELRCGKTSCSGATPFCSKGEDGSWDCAPVVSNAIAPFECLNSADCAPGYDCCVGMGSRCVGPGGCGGGDTPVLTCTNLSDCQERWGMKPKACAEPSDTYRPPGIFICQY